MLHKDGSAITVHARIQPVHDAHGELMAMVGFSTDVTEQRRSEAERKRNEEELEYLARASAILDSSLDLPVTLQQLAELAVPFIGDGCMVDVRRQDGTIERFAAAAVNDQLREGFVRLHRHPIDPEGNHPIARAMRSGEPQLPEQIDERGPRRLGKRRPSTSRTCAGSRAGSAWWRRSRRASVCWAPSRSRCRSERAGFGDRATSRS